MSLKFDLELILARLRVLVNWGFTWIWQLIRGPNKLGVPKNMGSQKIGGLKNWGSQKFRGPKKIWGLKKLGS